MHEEDIVKMQKLYFSATAGLALMLGAGIVAGQPARAAETTYSHMQHLHGFINGKNAMCPGAGADVNHGRVVDLNETEAAG